MGTNGDSLVVVDCDRDVVAGDRAGGVIDVPLSWGSTSASANLHHEASASAC